MRHGSGFSSSWRHCRTGRNEPPVWNRMILLDHGRFYDGTSCQADPFDNSEQKHAGQMTHSHDIHTGHVHLPHLINFSTLHILETSGCKVPCLSGCLCSLQNDRRDSVSGSTPQLRRLILVVMDSFYRKLWVRPTSTAAPTKTPNP